MSSHYSYLEEQLVGMKYVVDIGTFMGGSALAMKRGVGDGTVVTLDTHPVYQRRLLDVNGIIAIHKNLLEEPDLIEWDKIDYIFLDVDPHDGVQEREFVKLFEERLPKDKVVRVLFDDIFINEGMRKFWEELVLRENWNLEVIKLSERAFGVGTYNAIR